MIQRCQYPRFTLESCNTLGIVAERFRKKLDCDTAAQLGIGGLIHITHSTGSDVIGDLVMCQPRADHGVRQIWLRILPDNAHHSLI